MEEIRGSHEVNYRPDMQLDVVMVEMEVVRDYFMDQHEHMVMIE